MSKKKLVIKNTANDRENVAWVYRTPNRGFKRIKDKLGFYPWGSGDLSVESSD